MAQQSVTADVAYLEQLLQRLKRLEATALHVTEREQQGQAMRADEEERIDGTKDVEVVGGVGEDCDSGGMSSWSDEMSEDMTPSHASSLEMPAGVIVSADVRGTVKFGGTADAYEGRKDIQEVSHSFMKTFVRTDAVRRLKEFVCAKAGCKIRRGLLPQFALCAYTAATMPSAFVEGRSRLADLVAVGDAALTYHLVVSEVMRGRHVKSAQVMKADVASNASLRDVCVNSGMAGLIVFAPDVDVKKSVTVSNTLYAVVGFLALNCGDAAVLPFLRSMQLLE